jgi:hypothetical protein
LHHLRRLRGQVALANNPTLLIGRYLSRNVDRARA